MNPQQIKIHTDLKVAVTNEDHASMRDLILNKGANINLYFLYSLPLMRLVTYGSLESVKVAIELGADPLHSAFSQYGSIIEAAAGNMKSNSDILKFVLSELDISGLPNRENHISNALNRAIYRDNITNVNFLLEQGADPNAGLYSAAVLSQEAMKILISAGADYTHLGHNSGLNATQFALHRGKPHPLSYSILPDASNQLQINIFNNVLEGLEELSEKSFDHMSPALHIAVQYGSFDMVKKLVGLGHDATSVSTSYPDKSSLMIKGGDGIWHAFVRRSSFDEQLFEYLLTSEANKNLVSTYDMTPLMLAITLKKFDFMEKMLGNGFDPNVATANGTAGHFAVLKIYGGSDISALRILVNNMLDINAKYPANYKSKYYRGMTVRRLALNKIFVDLVDLREENGNFMTY